MMVAAWLAAWPVGADPPREPQPTAVRDGDATRVNEGLTLRTALAVTGARAPALAIARARRAVVAGARLEQAGAFDSVLDSTMSQSRYSCAGANDLRDDRTALRVGVQQRSTLGILWGPYVEVGRDNCLVPGMGEYGVGTTSRIGGSAAIPLLRGAGRVARVALDAAEKDQDAADHGVTFVTSELMLGTVNAYWSYRAAFEQLVVLRAAEDIGRRSLTMMETLTERKEVSPSEQIPIRASLAERARARVAGEQALFAARVELAVAMGLDANDAASLGEPSAPFPELSRELPDLVTLHALADAQRADVMAARKQLEALQLLAGGAENLVLPQVDLGASVQYGLSRRDDDLAALALRGNNVGLSASLALSVSLPVQNRERRGLLAARVAAADEARARLSDLVRRIHASVSVDRADVNNLAEVLLRAREARDAYATARDNETRKVTAGISTVLDLIVMQDRAIAANLEAIAVTTRLAQAMGRLAFDTGALDESGVLDGYPYAAGLRGPRKEENP